MLTLQSNDKSRYVFFPDEAKVGQKAIETYLKKIEEEEITRAIIVVSQGMSPRARSVISLTSNHFFRLRL